MDKPKILFLFSDTGGGHRSASEAIIEALNLEFPDQFETEMIDIFREYAPLPLNYAPEIYPKLSKMPKMWGIGYKASDGLRQTKLIYKALMPYVRLSLQRLLYDHPSDLIVSVHQMVNTPMVNVKEIDYPRFVTVVTDLVSTHVAWYDNGADFIIVPTIMAAEKAISLGVNQDKLKVIGQPIAEKYTLPPQDEDELREKFGWKKNITTILMVGGGEGMGPLAENAFAINRARLDVQLIIIAGRNEELKQNLESHQWVIPVKVYGFVREMPEFMHASNVLITKAGPGTISEAFIAGLPLILYSKMPGQEDGNVTYVVEKNAGVWAPEPSKVVATLREWLNDPSKMALVSENSKKLANPKATRMIAKELAYQIELSLKAKPNK